jgi:hypothetical protein
MELAARVVEPLSPMVLQVVQIQETVAVAQVLAVLAAAVVQA